MSLLGGGDPARPPEADRCCVCGKDLPKGTGRFHYDVYAICVACHDAGHRRPPLQKNARSGS